MIRPLIIAMTLWLFGCDVRGQLGYEDGGAGGGGPGGGAAGGAQGGGSGGGSGGGGGGGACVAESDVAFCARLSLNCDGVSSTQSSIGVASGPRSRTSNR